MTFLADTRSVAPGKPLGWHWFKGFPGGFFRGKFTREEIVEWYDRYDRKSEIMTPGLRAEGEAHRTATLAEYDAWKADCDKVDADHDVPALREADRVATEQWKEADRALSERPVTNFFGLAVKLAHWAASYGHMAYIEEEDADPEELFLLSLWRASVQLVGLPEEFGVEQFRPIREAGGCVAWHRQQAFPT